MTASRSDVSVWSGVSAGLVGLGAFLVLHHLWITPIWFIAPMGAAIAGLGGAVVGVTYAELLPRLPRRPWRVPAVMLGIAAILAPAVVIAELTGPLVAMTPDGGGTLAVSSAEAIVAFVGGLIATAVVVGGVLGAAIGRTRRATALGAGSGLLLALGPGHNVPLLGGTPVVATELAILAVVVTVASAVLVEGEARLRARGSAEV